MIAEAFSKRLLCALQCCGAPIRRCLPNPLLRGGSLCVGGRLPHKPFVEMRMNLEAYRIHSEPFYQPVADEIAVFEAAFAERLPVMLKGPTGCGKTRFVEHMAWRLGRPLVTVACHEDLAASDLVGRYLVRATETVW